MADLMDAILKQITRSDGLDRLGANLGTDSVAEVREEAR